MRLTHLLLWLLLLFGTRITHAQQYYYNQQENFLNANSVWVFGRNAGVNFNSGVPVAFVDSFNALEGAASVADFSTGALLFYSNGNRCWNRNGLVMPNGSNLFGNENSTTQGVCIVPVIDSPGKYYLFSLQGPTDGDIYPNGGSLFYSVIDMGLHSGLGDVENSRKNIILDKDTLSESMIAIPGNNCDIWLMVHLYGQPLFKAYHITRNGIDPNPVISQTGEQLSFRGDDSTTFGGSYFVGGMAVSPDRQRIAIASLAPLCLTGPVDSLSGVLLCKFDPETGKVSDAIQIEKDLQTYTCAFSPDNNKLYLGHLDYATNLQLFQQYDISNFDATAIDSSKETVGSIVVTMSLFGSNLALSYLRLYRDTIYIMPEGDYSISTINNPNLSGTLCDFQYASIPLAAGSRGSYSLPNEVVYIMPPDTVNKVIMDTLICEGWDRGIDLWPELISNDYVYAWSTGSSDSIISITDDGTYWVAYNNGCYYRTDTFKMRGSDLIEPVITVEVFTLGTTMPYPTYQWLFNGDIIPGAKDKTYTVTQNGVYQVIVTGENGCTDTSDVYHVTNYTSIADITLLAEEISIYPNPVKDILYIHTPVTVNIILTSLEGKVIREKNNVRQLSLKDLAPGVYLLKVKDNKGRWIKTEKFIRV